MQRAMIAPMPRDGRAASLARLATLSCQWLLRKRHGTYTTAASSEKVRYQKK